MKNEDLIVKILTHRSLRDFYRFYGARHSTINLGYKIDFEEWPNAHFLPQARNIMHLSHAWEKDFARVFAWQKFITLLERHLEGVGEIDEFYLHLLDDCAHKLTRQNPMRAMLESYAQILRFEGRLRLEEKCFVCNKNLGDRIWLARAFLPACAQCLQTNFIFNKQEIFNFLQHANTTNLDDELIQNLWQILCLGL